MSVNQGVTIAGNILTINPGAYIALNSGENEVITYSYNVSDGTDLVSQTATVTINGITLNFGSPVPQPPRISVENTIRGTNDRDNLRGANTDDQIVGRGDNDRVFGGDGDDLMKGGSGDDIMKGQDGDDRLSGQSGNNRLLGQNGDDFLIGGNDDDVLRGGNDSDILLGKRGDDVLIGGSDKDMFVFRNLNEGIDTIRGFDVIADVIDISRIFRLSQYVATPEQQFRQFIQLEQVGSDTQVKIDQDGIGQATNFITIAVVKNTLVDTITSANFVLS